MFCSIKLGNVFWWVGTLFMVSMNLGLNLTTYTWLLAWERRFSAISFVWLQAVLKVEMYGFNSTGNSKANLNTFT